MSSLKMALVSIILTVAHIWVIKGSGNMGPFQGACPEPFDQYLEDVGRLLFNEGLEPILEDSGAELTF